MSLNKLCEGAGTAIKKIAKEINDGEASILDTLVPITGKIKDLEANPTIEAIVDIVPYGSQVEGWINKAMDLIYGVIDKPTVQEKIQFVLNMLPTEYSKNRDVLKIAQVGLAVADDFQLAEHVYDQMVNVKLASLQANQPVQNANAPAAKP